jgi:hypothetical protein
MDRNRAASERTPDAEPDLESHSRVPAVIGCIGVAGSLVLAGILWRSERSAARERFTLDGLKLMDAARRELQLHLEQLHALSSLYRGSKLVEPPELRALSRAEGVALDRGWRARRALEHRT